MPANHRQPPTRYQRFTRYLLVVLAIVGLLPLGISTWATITRIRTGHWPPNAWVYSLCFLVFVLAWLNLLRQYRARR
ncbi:hypothetical protein GIS00_12065 [Nakamurella sp. YIM 132087]|uniref:Uncharacterized protein n=1 Tax=Nakamurella alba TaxID=2665158 RepID=A0A7K1FKP1_9ACTN|nr:hypothetical protein [Nakamurella alba]MTD14678.1 hypothetical protein [Nakamurella alba]